MSAFDEVPPALRDDPWTRAAPPAEEASVWHPPWAKRPADAGVCTAPFADDAHGAVGGQSVAVVDPVAELHLHLKTMIAEQGKRAFDECLARERENAEASCIAGMFPDGGIDDHTTGETHSRGRAHTIGGGFEAGWNALKLNGGYEHTRSTEHGISSERTRRGEEGTRQRCLTDFMRAREDMDTIGRPK